jgi:hygromycin-B 4-O-kinase
MQFFRRDDTKKSTFKTRIKDKDLRNFLYAQYGSSVSNIQYLEGGEISQAYSFDAPDGEYIIRVSRHGTDTFKKDQYAHFNFSSDSIPVPKVVHIGQIDAMYYYAVAKRVLGKPLSAFNDDDEKKGIKPKNVPEMCIKLMDDIHSIDISNTTGYGPWNETGEAPKPSWREFIMSIGKEGWWADMFKNTFLEEGTYTLLYQRLGQLIEFCPEERQLIHGDFSLDNLICDGKQITAVTDWGDSKYGDFLYDIAWLIFWPSEYDFEKICNDYYTKRIFMNYKERILCYQIHIALSLISFYAKSLQQDKYEWAKKRIDELMAPRFNPNKHVKAPLF